MFKKITILFGMMFLATLCAKAGGLINVDDNFVVDREVYSNSKILKKKGENIYLIFYLTKYNEDNGTVILGIDVFDPKDKAWYIGDSRVIDIYDATLLQHFNVCEVEDGRFVISIPNTSVVSEGLYKWGLTYFDYAYDSISRKMNRIGAVTKYNLNVCNLAQIGLGNNRFMEVNENGCVQIRNIANWNIEVSEFIEDTRTSNNEVYGVSLAKVDNANKVLLSYVIVKDDGTEGQRTSLFEYSGDYQSIAEMSITSSPGSGGSNSLIKVGVNKFFRAFIDSYHLKFNSIDVDGNNINEEEAGFASPVEISNISIPITADIEGSNSHFMGLIKNQPNSSNKVVKFDGYIPGKDSI